ncbi:glycosyl hydrolase 2 galactose-binding domain-containing protein, partial [Acinetobacter baumannii]|uniref:glycosyl hydrolase 2 galactose-binding domain-containing protein n=1 Tax=Acinetobacter baumannii TaxID=470 RepID=UPI0024B7A931
LWPVAPQFDVRPLLHAGDNTVSVAFDPLQPYIAAKVAAAKGKGRLVAIKGMGEVRTEPCANGWDFGPK